MSRRQKRVGLVGLVLSWAWAAAAALMPLHGQAPMLPPAHRSMAPVPLLYVRFAGAPGMQATYYQGSPLGHTLPAGEVVGLRPGYRYRVKLTMIGLPGFRPNEMVTLYPTLEVRGVVQLPPTLSSRNYPLTVVLHPEEIERVVHTGAMVSKVVALENPEKAYPAQSRADEPFEIALLPNQELLEQSRTLGRPLVIVRVGEREVEAEELAQQSIMGTVLLPGARGLTPPAAPPTLPFACWPLYDPILGPTCEDLCLPDGGDVGLRAGIGPQGTLQGVDPSDTVAQYADSKGNKKVAVSNRVCLCVPRYIVFKQDVRPAGYDAVRAPADAQGALAQALVKRTQAPNKVLQNEHLLALRMKARPSGIEQFQGASVIGRNVVTDTVYQAQIPNDKTGVCIDTKTAPDKPLILHKWIDTQSAKIGDVVTFFLRYTNPGGQPIADIVVADSLISRFEYVADSAKTDRDAVFTAQKNEAGSTILRWQINGKLPPGQSGLVSFQARVR